jgi:hypothetical protein
MAKYKCYYCDEKAEYNDIVGEPGNYSVASVCKKHVTNYLSA